MYLDFSAAPQSNIPRCFANGLNRENCIRATALHEFGHAIGFDHEHERPTTPQSCTETGARSGGGDYTFGNYDPNSIMNYCTPKAVPSNFDLAGLIDIYGPEVGQPMAQRTSGLCIGPEIPNPMPPQGMRATLDGFCFGEDGRSWLGMELTASGLLRSVYSGMCLVPEGSGLPENNARLLYTSACYPTPLNAVFFLTAGGSFMHFLSGKCVTPSNGSSNPAPGTPLVLSANCNNASQQFKGVFKANSRIGHNSGLCIHPEGGSANPTNDTRAVLQNDCRGTGRTDFVMRASGSIQHVSSGKCLHPSGGSANPANNTDVVFWSGCDETRLAFELTARGSLRHVASGKCLHPRGGAAEPAAGTKLVFHDGCDEDRLRFGAVYW